MRRVVILVMLLSASTAGAEDPSSGPFVSGGLVLSVGSRGFTIGLEASGGWVDAGTGTYAGAAVGFDYAPKSADLPVRLYIEGEGGWLAFGVGVGPAFFFNGQPTALQVTPYVAIAPGAAECDHPEPFITGGAFYRYTRISQDGVQRNLHEGGGLAKQLWFPNGKRDHGVVCIH